MTSFRTSLFSTPHKATPCSDLGLRRFSVLLILTILISSAAAPLPVQEIVLLPSGPATIIEGRLRPKAMQRYQFKLSAAQEVLIQLACAEEDVSFQLVSPDRLPIYDSRYAVEGRHLDMLLSGKGPYEIDILPGLDHFKARKGATSFTLAVSTK